MTAALAATDLTPVGWRTPNNIRSLRLAVRPPMTQAALALRLACSQQEVAAWETGARVPTLARALAIAIALGASVEAVFFAHAAAASMLPASHESGPENGEVDEQAAQRGGCAGPSPGASRGEAPSMGEALPSL